MDISPAVPTPQKGDPITAAWAAQVASAVNSAATALTGDDSMQTPFGAAEPPRVAPALLGKQKHPQPFDCIIYNDHGADKVEIYLPSGGAALVWYGDNPLSPAQGQSVGTATSGWVLAEAVQNSKRYIYLCIHKDTNGDADGWQIHTTGTPDTLPGWALPGSPMVLIAIYNTTPAHYQPNGAIGLCQYHHGTISIGEDIAEILDTEASPGDPPGESLNRFAEDPESQDPHPDGQIQLRQFHDTNDTETVAPIGDTGGGTNPANLHTCFRKVGQGTADVRPKLVYVPADKGPFWVQGADESVNFGTAIKLGDSSIGFVTISVTQ